MHFDFNSTQYRPGQANRKFQLLMLLMKNPQFFTNFAQNSRDWTHHWAKIVVEIVELSFFASKVAILKWGLYENLSRNSFSINGKIIDFQYCSVKVFSLKLYGKVTFLQYVKFLFSTVWILGKFTLFEKISWNQSL